MPKKKTESKDDKDGGKNEFLEIDGKNQGKSTSTVDWDAERSPHAKEAAADAKEGAGVSDPSGATQPALPECVQTDSHPETAPQQHSDKAVTKKVELVGMFAHPAVQSPKTQCAEPLAKKEEAPHSATPKKEIQRRTIRDGYSYTVMVYDEKEHEYNYVVEEPKLSQADEEDYALLKENIASLMDFKLEKGSEHRAEEHLRQAAENIFKRRFPNISPDAKEKILYYLLRDLRGFGRIDAILHDPDIEDISCDGPKTPVFVYHRGFGSVESSVSFATEAELDSFVGVLAQRSGKQISILDPMLDATLPDGSRLQATLSREVTPRGSSFTIRKFRESPYTPSDLVNLHTMSSEMAAYFWLAIENEMSALFAGGTGSGKTTTLNAMSLFIPPSMKIVTIEDTREINLPHKNWLSSITRGSSASTEGKVKQRSEVDMFDLLRAALRQRPQYMIVGEVRGREASTLFQAMATGITTYSTMHADSVSAVVYRLENPPINMPRILLGSLKIIALQTQVKIGDKPAKVMKNITEIIGISPENGELMTNEVFSWKPADGAFEFTGRSAVFEAIGARKNMQYDDVLSEFKRRVEVVEWMGKGNANDFKDVGWAVSAYYKSPDGVIKGIREGTFSKPKTGPKE